MERVRRPTLTTAKLAHRESEYPKLLFMSKKKLPPAHVTSTFKLTRRTSPTFVFEQGIKRRTPLFPNGAAAPAVGPLGKEADPAKRRKGGVIGHAVNPASLKNLQRGRSVPLVVIEPPILTEASAAEYVRIRMSGAPPLDAVAYFADARLKLNPKEWAALAKMWESSPLVTEQWTLANGSEWHHLPVDIRTSIALDQHLAQLVYFLRHADFNAPDAPLGKIAHARDAILAHLDRKAGGGELSKFEQVMREVLEGKGALPPVMGKVATATEQLDMKLRES